ncbi:MAG: LysR family transcriptional regulator substrate-binding protein, partial [Oscillospiraceae bacterium]
IGVSDTISRYLLLPYLEKFHHVYPEIKLKIINRTTLDTLSLLRLGKVDVAFVNLPVDDNDIEVKKTFPVQDTFVVGKQLLHLANEPMTPKEIAALPLILLERKSNSRLYVERFYLKNGAVLNPEIELGSHDLLLEFARINLGVSCVIRQFSQHYLKSGELTELKQTIAIPRRNVGLVCHKGMSLSPAANTFLMMFEDN